MARDEKRWLEISRRFAAGTFYQRRYFPGIFIQFNSQTAGQEKDSAVFILRGGDDGKDYLGPEITQTG